MAKNGTLERTCIYRRHFVRCFELVDYFHNFWIYAHGIGNKNLTCQVFFPEDANVGK